MKSLLKPFVFVVLFSTLTIAQSQTYVGSSNSNKYHLSTCRWAQKINGKNKITFKSKKEAESKGYQPCKVCKP